MGHAADIALGLALAVPERRVVCVNGDGSLAMNLGGLVTAAGLAPANLTQIVILNHRYQIVGGPPIPGGRGVNWAGLAEAAGWRRTGHCQDSSEFAARLAEWLEPPGPAFVTVEVVDSADMPQCLPRRHPAVALAELRQAVAEARGAKAREAEARGAEASEAEASGAETRGAEARLRASDDKRDE
jgi:phosphonopyruvate decarboxylase